MINDNNQNSIINILSSNLFPGLGKKTAKIIYDIFLDNTLNIIVNTPEKIYNINNLSAKKKEKIYNTVLNAKSENSIILSLLIKYPKFNIINKIYQKYLSHTEFVLFNNPYSIIDDMDKIGFNTINDIVEKLNISVAPHVKIYYFSREFIRNQIISTSDTAINLDILIGEITNKFNYSPDIIKSSLNICFESQLLYKIDNFITSEKYYTYEQYIYNKIVELKNTNSFITNYNKIRDNNSHLNSKQLEAINNALKYKISIISGGPGTGKTTIIKYILQLINNYNFILTAPTGRAAKRMQETTGEPAITIHRLLEAGKDGMKFNKNSENKIDADFIIVDEFSMVDSELFYHLLKAISFKSNLILIGDYNQLPSIGPGNILYDLMLDDFLPKTILNYIYRQNDNSDIIINSNNIISAKALQCDNNKDFYIFNIPNFNIRLLTDIYYNRLPKLLNFKPKNLYELSTKIQIISPYRDNHLGSKEINKNIQAHYHKDPDEIKIENENGECFYVSDKIIQNVNDYNASYFNMQKNIYEKGVFNGEIGFITDIYEDKVSIVFDDYKAIEYDRDKLNNISLAFCLTVHKSQGSEFDNVIFPIFISEYNNFINKNLLYTGFTRAKNNLILMCNKSNLNYFIKQNISNNRNTILKLLIKKGTV